jgi:uncharacterized membrane protein YkoI
MKKLNTLLLVSAAALLAACASTKDSSQCSKKTASCCTSTSSSSKTCGVPSNILAAAQAKVPGFAMTSYDTDTDNGAKVYELDGTANGRKCEVKVDATGKVLKIDRD